MLGSPERSLEAVRDADFLEDTVEVGLDRVRAYTQIVGDLVVGKPSTYMREDLHLPVRETIADSICSLRRRRLALCCRIQKFPGDPYLALEKFRHTLE